MKFIYIFLNCRLAEKIDERDDPFSNLKLYLP